MRDDAQCRERGKICLDARERVSNCSLTDEIDDRGDHDHGDDDDHDHGDDDYVDCDENLQFCDIKARGKKENSKQQEKQANRSAESCEGFKVERKLLNVRGMGVKREEVGWTVGGGGGGRDEGVRGRILFGLNCPCLGPGRAEVGQVIGDQRGAAPMQGI